MDPVIVAALTSGVIGGAFTVLGVFTARGFKRADERRAAEFLAKAEAARVAAAGAAALAREQAETLKEIGHKVDGNAASVIERLGQAQADAAFMRDALKASRDATTQVLADFSAFRGQVIQMLKSDSPVTPQDVKDALADKTAAAPLPTSDGVHHS